MRLANKHAILGRLGSFWSQNLTEESIRDFRRLVHMVSDTAAIGTLQATMSALSGAGTSCVEHRALKLSAKDVTVLVDDLQKRVVTLLGTSDTSSYIIRRADDTGTVPFVANALDPATGAFALADPSGSLLVFPCDDPNAGIPVAMDAPRFAVRIPSGWRVMSVHCGGRTKLAGVDFVQHGNLLLFWEDTRFELTEHLIVGRADADDQGLWRYPFSVDGIHNGPGFVADYYTAGGTAAAFERAIAEAAGLVVSQTDCTVLGSCRDVTGATVYFTTAGNITAAYPHDEIPSGTAVQAGYVIGEYVKVLTPSEGNWWRATDWSAGISLDQICPVKGLQALDTPTMFDSVEDTGGTPHARPHWREVVSGRNTLRRYWSHLKGMEIASGDFLAERLGMDSVGSAVVLNGVDALFNLHIRNRSIVVELRLRHLGASVVNSALSFIAREKPINVITIINVL